MGRTTPQGGCDRAPAPPRVARRMRRAVGLPEREGVLVRDVRDGSPADRAGLRRGDLIVTVDGREDDRLDTLHAALDSGAATIELGLVRGGILAVWRLLRCNPWSRGGVDRVEDRTLFRGREERCRA